MLSLSDISSLDMTPEEYADPKDLRNDEAELAKGKKDKKGDKSESDKENDDQYFEERKSHRERREREKEEQNKLTQAGSEQDAVHNKLKHVKINEFQDDGEDVLMKDMISKGGLKTNLMHIKLVDSNFAIRKHDTYFYCFSHSAILKFDGGKFLRELSKKTTQRSKIKYLKSKRFH